MKYTKEFLESQTIYFLRCIGYEVGVKAPTSKKRDELIQCILDVQNGEATPYFSPKAEKNFNFINILGNEFLIYEEEENYEREIQYRIKNDNSAKLTFDNNVLIFNDSRTGLDLNERIVSGYYYTDGKMQNSLVSYENPMVLEKLADIPFGLNYGNRIKIGNYVKAIITKDRVKFPKVTKILEIEGQPARNFYVEEFEYKKVCFDKQIYFSQGSVDINYGDRVLYAGDKHMLLNNLINLITKDCDYCESVIVLAPNITPERVNSLQKIENIELFHTLFSDSLKTLYFTNKLAVEHAKRMAELGKRVILVVSDIDAFFEGDANVYDTNGKNEALRSLFGLARTFEGAGSVTVIGTCSKEFYNSHNDFKNYIDVLFSEMENGLFDVKNLNTLRYE